MKITIELDDYLEDVEVVIRTSQLTPEIESIKRSLEKAVAPPFSFIGEIMNFTRKLRVFFSLRLTAAKSMRTLERKPTRSSSSSTSLKSSCRTIFAESQSLLSSIPERFTL